MKNSITGTELRELRRSLSLTDDSLAKMLGITPKYLRQAERLGDDEIPTEQFKMLLEKLIELAPRMILMRLQSMQQVANLLKAISGKLKMTEKWLRFEGKNEAPEEATEEDKEERRISPSGVDRRSAAE